MNDVGLDPAQDGPAKRIASLEAELAACRAEGAALRAENAALRAEGARCRRLFEQSPLSIQVHGPDWFCRATNPAHDRLWNVTQRQMAGWSMYGSPQLAEAGVRPMLERAFAGEVQAVPAHWFDAAEVAPGGRRAWVDSVVFPLRNEAGEVEEVALLHQDVSALGHAERLARGQADALAGTLARLAREPDLDAFLGHVLAEIARQAGTRTAGLFTYDPQAGTLAQHATVWDGALHRGHHPDDPPLFRAPFPADVTPAFRLSVEQRHLFTINLAEAPDGLMWPGTREAWTGRGFTTVGALALVAGDHPVGFLGLGWDDRAGLSEAQRELVQALANQAALALELTRLAEEARKAAVAREREQAAQERAAELARANAALRQAIESLRDLDDLDAFLVRVVAAAEQVSGASGATVFLIDEDRREATMRLFVQDGAVLDIAADPALAFWREPLTEARGYDQRVVDKVFRTPGHWWVAADDPDMLAGSRAWHEAQGHRSIAHVPMFRDGRPLGFLGLGFREAVRPSQSKLEMVQVLAQQVTLAFELTRLADEARAAAVARERERAAEERAARLAQVNAVLRRGVERTAGERDFGRLLGHLLLEAAEAAGAAGGALFLHKGGTAFEPAAVVDGGTVVPPERWWREPLFRRFVELSSRDEDGRFAAILSRDVGDPAPVDAATLWPEALAYHRTRAHHRVWNRPLVLGNEVVGFLGLARADERPPEREVVEVVEAVVGQMAIAVQLARLAEEAKEVAVAREREQAAQKRAAELARANEALASYGRLLEGAALAAQALLGAADLDAALARALAHLGEAADVSRLMLLRHLDADGGPALEVTHEWCAPDVPAQFADPELGVVPYPSSEVFHLVRAGQPWAALLDDMPEPFRQGQAQLGVASLIGVPVFVGGAYWGVLDFDECRWPRAWDAAEVAALRVCASVVGAAIERQRNLEARAAAERAAAREREQAAQERAAELARANTALQGTLARLAKEPDLDAFLGHVLAEIAQQAGADGPCHVFVYDPAARTLAARVAVEGGAPRPAFAAGDPALFAAPFPADITPAVDAMVREGTLVQHFAADHESLAWPGTLDWHRSKGHRAVGALALMAGRRLAGVLGLSFLTPTELTADKQALIRALASQAALAIELERLAVGAREAAVAREREAAAEKRVAQLAKANAALRGGVNAVASGGDLDALLGQTLLACVRHVGTSRNGAIVTVAPHDGRMRPRAYVEDGELASLEDPGWPLQAEAFAIRAEREDTGLFARLRAGEAVITDIDDPESAKLLWPEFQALHRRLGHHVVSHLPLHAGAGAERRFLGFLGFGLAEPGPPSAELLAFMETLSAQASLAVEMDRLAAEAKAAAVAREREQAAQQHAARLAGANQALARSAARLAAEPELEGFLRGVLEEAAGQAGAFANALFFYDPEGHALRMRLYVREGEVLDVLSDPRMAVWREPVPADLGPAWAELSAGRPVTHLASPEDAYTWPHTVAWHAAMGHAQVVAVPLLAGGRAIGFMGLSFRHKGEVAPEALALAQALASQAVLATELTRLADAAKQAALAEERAAELARANVALARSTARLAAEPDLDAFLGAVLVEAAGQTGARGSALFLYDPEAHAFSMRLYALDGDLLDIAADPRMAVWREPVPARLNGTWQNLRQFKPLVQAADTPDPDLWPHTVHWHRMMGHAALVSIALFAGERLLGFVGLCFRERASPAPERIELAQALASQAVLALELMRLTAAVRDSEARLLLAHEAAGIGAWDWDLATGDVVWVPHTFRLWGIAPPADGSNMLPAETILQAIHPEDQARVRAELDTAVAWGTPFRSEFRVVPESDAGVRWLGGLGRHVPAGAGPGRAARMIGVNLDVTARRAADQARADGERLAELSRANTALRATLDALPMGGGNGDGVLDPFLAQVLAAVAELLHAPEAVLWLHDADDATRVHQVFRDGTVMDAAASSLAEAARPLPLAAMDPGWTRPDTAAQVGPVLPEAVDDVASDSRLTDAHRARLLAQGVRALLLFPMALRGGRTVGTLSLRLPAPRHHAPEDVELARALTQQATLAIHLDQLARRARDQARQSAVLDERNRAAQEIHDALAQCFTSILLQLQAAARFTDGKPELACACLARAEALARDGLAEARRSVAALLPGAEEHRDLPGTLRRLARQATAGTSAPATVRVAGTSRELAPDVARNLYRIAQEALGNAQRYALGASGIQVRLRYGAKGVSLTIRDDGGGFDPSSLRQRPGHGLAGMQARAERIGASFSLDSRPGGGTRVRVWLPHAKEGS